MFVTPLDFVSAEGRFGAWLGVMAINATKRPEELMEGRILSAPTSAPPGSLETRIVDALQEASAWMHVSRK